MSDGRISVKEFGAKGDGSDDTAAVAAAFTAAHAAGSPGESGAAVYFPAGRYRVESFPELWSFDSVLGDGPDMSTVVFEGSGTLVRIQGLQRVSFKQVGFWITGTDGCGFRVSNSFRCSFDSVVIRGQHMGANYPAYADSVGVALDQNTGGTSFLNCDINNFGVGLSTSCIQNYVTNSKFSMNHTGVLGTGNNFNAGLAITNSEFVSDNSDAANTASHINIDGAANDWWLTNVWFEGARTAVVVGAAGTGGPSQFGMMNCKVAARDCCVDLRYCRQPTLMNVIFDADVPENPPLPLRIDPVECPEGIAVNPISGFAHDIPQDLFPPEWTVLARTWHQPYDPRRR